MATKAKQFLDALSKVADSYEQSVEVGKQFPFTRQKVNNEKRMVFDDGSYAIVGAKEGQMFLPERFA